MISFIYTFLIIYTVRISFLKIYFIRIIIHLFSLIGIICQFWNGRASLKMILNVKIYFQIKFPYIHVFVPRYRLIALVQLTNPRQLEQHNDAISGTISTSMAH